MAQTLHPGHRPGRFFRPFMGLEQLLTTGHVRRGWRVAGVEFYKFFQSHGWSEIGLSSEKEQLSHEASG